MQRYCLSLRGKRTSQTATFSLNCTLKLVANPKPCGHVRACAQNILGKHPFFSLHTKSCACTHTHKHTHTVSQMTEDESSYDFLLKTQLNDPCQHNLIFSNACPELLTVGRDIHNVHIHCDGMQVPDFFCMLNKSGITNDLSQSASVGIRRPMAV